MKIVIAGTGAMGATYGGLLAKAGHDVVFLDSWQANIDAINDKGICLDNLGQLETINAKAYLPEEYHDSPDLLVVFTKSMQLRDMLDKVKHLISDKTHILCLLNGLGHIDTLKEYVSLNQIIMGVTVVTAGMIGPGQFKVTSRGRTELQDMGEQSKDFVLDAVNHLTEAGLPTEYSEDILYSIWRKACLNGTMNACCALLDCNMLELGQIRQSRELLGQIVAEFAAVAAQEGTMIDVEQMTDFVCWHTTEAFGGVHHYPSMHQDLVQNHRLTEIDYLNGYVARKGKAYGLETKYCELITLLVHAKEQLVMTASV
ncbi:2-dehydropantoate 2-reductase [Streptococcus fryi]